jgi:hypothetical protein
MLRGISMLLVLLGALVFIRAVVLSVSAFFLAGTLAFS